MHSRCTRGDRHSSRVEAQKPALLSNATGFSWSSLGGLNGFKAPEAFGERSRDWSLGHAGDDGPHLAMTGESRGCSRARPQCAVSQGTTARSVSLSGVAMAAGNDHGVRSWGPKDRHPRARWKGRTTGKGNGTAWSSPPLFLCKRDVLSRRECFRTLIYLEMTQLLDRKSTRLNSSHSSRSRMPSSA